MTDNLKVWFIISIAVALLMGKILIPILTKLKAGQSIREDGPKSHLKKNGTPTIGGLIFLSALVIITLLSGNLSPQVWILILSTSLFALTGFIDDYIKVTKERNLGLTAKQKLFLQIVGALIILIYQYKSKSLSSDLFIPFIKTSVNIGLMYIPFIIFVIVGTVNSVNLTDGLDGLAAGTSIITLGFFAIAANKLQNYHIEFFCIALMGSLFGFLYFNRNPAKVFMGDTGSLSLGGAISAVAVLLNLPLILPIAGGIFFIETLSVIIQVASFKLRGKRVFLMAPLHHHFEESGWKESKVVIVFYIVQFVLCVISYFVVF
ncbi:phospho-N-acetylmuramoyl-pentapeptide-transferase [Peptoniphilus catoniae]|uniref:phospho-N-acetylmuramoyl-pentapeptide- transferase n=1 Tax=Peptoniphilus catoniae TaxID=1660341 RepID=UPI0010FE60D9|nr:phospho-N-acetylmuramoyl-pentapeptide-transferase [Peptoniphilus catoniae]